MLKISEGKGVGQITTLRLEGRIVGPWVEELRQVCQPIVEEEGNVALDLAEVTFADEGGVRLLSSLRSRGVKLLRAMPFVEEQLKSSRLIP